jgi:hypothetical protein
MRESRRNYIRLFLSYVRKQNRALAFRLVLASTLIICLLSSGTLQVPAQFAQNFDFYASPGTVRNLPSENAEYSLQNLLSRNEPAETPSEVLWTNFRQTYAFHAQFLALSEASSDNSRTLIISEPPPHITIEQILPIFGELLLSHQIKKHLIGYDGWVKDVVITLKGSDSEISAVLSRINQKLFFTSYKSYILPLKTAPPAISPIIEARKYNLDLSVTPAEIENWIKTPTERFIPLEGGRGLTFAQLTAEKASGVFNTQQRSLVVWWIPKIQTVEDCRIQARQFALDSDLIVGAVSKPTGLLVLGRVRSVPVDILPPLRVETISLLSAVAKGQAGELKQSYERRHPLAGKYIDHRDWAPILLSPEIRDTEYGSLLNITDQLLKGWSQNGQVKYYNFDYPQPNEWAFPKPLFIHLNAKSALTFNWNTKGVGYTLESGVNKIYALNRTASLPVSYIPENSSFFESSKETLEAEDKGYDYFAKRSDPNLTRVVQYAALYQIFSALGVAKPPELPSSDDRAGLALDKIYLEFVRDLTALSDEKITQLAQELLPTAQKLLQAQNLPNLKQHLIANETERIEDELKLAGISKGTPKYNEMRQQKLAEIDGKIGDLEKSLPTTSEKLAQNLKELRRHRPATFGEQLTLSALISFKKIPDLYSQKTEPVKNTWIHSQVIVISESTGDLAVLTGGHNLAAKVTKFKVGAVPVGKKLVRDVQGNFVVGLPDRAKLKGLLSSYKQLTKAGYSDSEIAELLNLQLYIEPTPALRSKQQALNYSQGPPDPPKPPIKTSVGWFDGKEPPPNLLADYQASQRALPGVISVKKNGESGFFITHSEFAKTLTASTKEDAADLIVYLGKRRSGNTDSIKLELTDFDPQEAYGFFSSCKVRSAEENFPKEIEGYLRTQDSDTPNLMNEVRATRFTYSATTISDPVITQTTAGQFKSLLTAEVPASNAPATKGTFHFELTFKRATTAEVAQTTSAAVKNKITGFFSKIGAGMNMIATSFKLRREISQISRETGTPVEEIKMWYKHQTNTPRIRDLFFVKKDKINGSLGLSQTE